jgi:hypothetical protein
MSWSDRFSEPIALPDGGRLQTLREAGEYITELPEAEQAEKRWQTAMHVVIQAAEHGGPLVFAQWGMLNAVNNPQPVYDTSRKDPAWRNNYKLVKDR